MMRLYNTIVFLIDKQQIWSSTLEPEHRRQTADECWYDMRKACCEIWTEGLQRNWACVSSAGKDLGRPWLLVSGLTMFLLSSLTVGHVVTMGPGQPIGLSSLIIGIKPHYLKTLFPKFWGFYFVNLKASSCQEESGPGWMHPLIPALGRQRQAGLSEFQASQDCLVRPWLKKIK
jgi:hypothetical protein